jgi:Cyclin, N-terminal domain
MRAILIDWLVDVAVHFDVKNETLHLAIGYLTRYLRLVTSCPRSMLQLIGVTCLKLADVFNERSKEYYRQENAKEYAFITADEYTESQVVYMEKEILTKLDFELNVPTTATFLHLIFK